MAIVGTVSGGLYYTTDVDGTPSWIEASTGLTSLNILFIAESLANTEVLVLTSDTHELFLWDKTTLTSSSILTDAQVKSDTGDNEVFLQNVCYDLLVADTIYAFAGPESGLKADKNVYILKSTDNGDSWALIATKFLDFSRAVGGIFARGGTVVAAVRGGLGTSSVTLYYSTDSGGSFAAVSMSGGGYVPWCWIAPSGLVLLRNGTDLASYNGSSITQLIADQTPIRPDAMKLDTSAFVNSVGVLYSSSDDWESYTTVNVDSEMQAIADLVGNTLSGTVNPSGGEPTAQLWDGVSFDNFNGIAPDDIPDSSGGTAYGIIGCVQIASVSLSSGGKRSEKANTNITFTATTTPSYPSPTVVYLWSSDGLQSGQGTATAVYKWSTVGTKTVTITVTNDCGTANGSATMSIFSTNREIPRDEIARLLTAGLGTYVQNVGNYEIADFKGRTVEIFVTSRASQRPKMTQQGRRVHHKYDIMVFVLYAQDGEWTELQAEDRLDLLEDEIYTILNTYTCHLPYWRSLDVANENGFSNITYPKIGGKEYKMETFTIDVQI